MDNGQLQRSLAFIARLAATHREAYQYSGACIAFFRASRDDEASMIQRITSKLNCRDCWEMMESESFSKPPRSQLILQSLLIWVGTLFISWLATFIQHFDELGTPPGDKAIWNALVFGFQMGCVLVILWTLKKALKPQGKLPSERLQEEFDEQHPDRAKKEDPPVPMTPPPRDDNPYSYR
jgi:hypothetical protein